MTTLTDNGLSEEAVEAGARALFVDHNCRQPDRLDDLEMATARRRARIVLNAARGTWDTAVGKPKRRGGA